MRKINTRYQSVCKKCGATLEINTEVMYEKRVGVFCVGCEPTDVEEIRQYKQNSRDKKAARYEEWAQKKREKANKVLDYNREHFTSDIAFNTQPGHIPLRERVIKQNDKAYQTLNLAREFDKKAESLRFMPRVKGDAKRKREAVREERRTWLKNGIEVYSPIFGIGTVVKLNKMSAKVQFGEHLLKVEIEGLFPVREK